MKLVGQIQLPINGVITEYFWPKTMTKLLALFCQVSEKTVLATSKHYMFYQMHRGLGLAVNF